MAIINRLVDKIVGVPSMRKVRDYRMEAMRGMYDPTIFNEIATRQRTRATEGLSDLAEQTALRRVASQASAPIDPSIVGGDAARALSMARTQQASVGSAYGDLASRLAEMDEQIRMQYGDAYAQTVGQQSQLAGMRRAGIAGEQATFEEERSMRRRQFGSEALRTALTVGAGLAGIPGGGSLADFISKRRSDKSLAAARADLMPGNVENMYIEAEPDLGTDIDFSNELPFVDIDRFVPNVDYDAMKMPLPSPSRVTNPQNSQPSPYVPPFLRSQDNMDWLYRPIKGIGGRSRRNPMEIMGGFGPITF